MMGRGRRSQLRPAIEARPARGGRDQPEARQTPLQRPWRPDCSPRLGGLSVVLMSIGIAASEGNRQPT
jgi:hypothetical protein